MRRRFTERELAAKRFLEKELGRRVAAQTVRFMSFMWDSRQRGYNGPPPRRRSKSFRKNQRRQKQEIGW